MQAKTDPLSWRWGVGVAVGVAVALVARVMAGLPVPVFFLLACWLALYCGVWFEFMLRKESAAPVPVLGLAGLGLTLWFVSALA